MVVLQTSFWFIINSMALSSENNYTWTLTLKQLDIFLKK